MLKNSLRNDYSIYWTSKIKSIKMDNNVFKQIKQISSYKKRDEMPQILSNENNEIFVSDKQKCDGFANQFINANNLTINNASIYEDSAERCYEEYNTNIPFYNFTNDIKANFKDENIHAIENENSDLFLSTIQLGAIIQSRHNKKSSGPDNVSNYIIKKLSKNAIWFFTILMNHITNIQHLT